VQVHVAYSSLIRGAAVYAGGPYYCAKGHLMTAAQQCMFNLMGGPNVTELVQFTNTAYKNKHIDNPANLKGHKAFVFSGTKDSVVKTPVVKDLETYYQQFDVEVENDYDLVAEHCLPTLNYGEACSIKASPYLGKCNHDGAGFGLAQLYGEGLGQRGTAKSANLLLFDQTPYIVGGTKASVYKDGYIYVPTACSKGATQCKLHLSFHGCSQNIDAVGDKYAQYGGFNAWAEENNIVVIYPNADSNAMEGNANGCWDWWGYTDKNYAYQTGLQMQFVMNVIDKVMGTSRK